ncbi:3106_t:CDS:1 [Diversispora eburnea]|uniref:3106_t:CDS:1 n=1 Tax=Diversispora eburnea TaxID=1213867 RepID=A0A9N9FWM0_9GLOM|nr:3106_t:CDS:1 [Diversispora eburnea]
MSFINHQNTTNIIKVPFPPSITIDEIVQMHLKNGIKNVNRTMNAFMIYRKEYSRIVAKFNLELIDVSKISSISWKNEPQHIKDYYKQFAKDVKRRFEEIVPSLCFVHINQVSDANDYHVPLDKNPLDTTYKNHPILPIHPPLSLRNIYQNFLDAYPPFTNSPLLNINQDVDPFFLNVDLYKYMTMDDDELIDYLPEDTALSYKAIIQSLPPQ